MQGFYIFQASSKPQPPLLSPIAHQQPSIDKNRNESLKFITKFLSFCVASGISTQSFQDSLLHLKKRLPLAARFGGLSILE
jgi:hypothetical protein